ncbi:hypothetical protein BKI52_44765 [marine bacterium AO1-C]|nr:hypothetical protein BKI52_44765 [marine bacterium AO1-C]
MVTNAYSQRRARKQYFYTVLGGGYHQANASPKGLNYVIERFNQTRNLVGDRAFQNIEQPTGFSAFLGGYGYLGNTAILLELRYGNAGVNLNATERPPSGPAIERDLRFNMHNIQVSFGLMGVSTENFGFGVAVAPDLGFHLINDKSGDAEVEIINNFTFSAAFSLPVHVLIGPIMLGIRPYYTLQLGTNDYTELNASLNPATYQRDPAEEQMSNLNYFGLEFRLGIVLGKRERR